MYKVVISPSANADLFNVPKFIAYELENPTIRSFNKYLSLALSWENFLIHYCAIVEVLVKYTLQQENAEK